ncbi:MAG: 4Fe-4S binding protein, partial [Candidatus Thorarchaeota archaeon]
MQRQRMRKLLLAISFILFQALLIANVLWPISAVSEIFQGMIFGSLVLISLLFIISLAFGRAFCGWLCPAAAVNEFCSAFIRKKATNEKLSKVKYLLFLLWLGEIVLELLRFFGVLPVPTSEASSRMGDSSMITLIILLVIPLALLLGTRANCRYFCWFAPVMSVVAHVSNSSRFPALHLKVNRGGIWCNRCGSCDDACPMGLHVMNMVETLSIGNSECILCGACVDACELGVLSLSFGIPVKPHREEQEV